MLGFRCYLKDNLSDLGVALFELNKGGMRKKVGTVPIPSNRFSQSIDIEYIFESNQILEAQISSKDTIIGSIQFSSHQALKQKELNVELNPIGSSATTTIGSLCISSLPKPNPDLESITFSVIAPLLPASSYFMMLFTQTDSVLYRSECKPNGDQWLAVNLNSGYFKDREGIEEKVSVVVYEYKNDGNHRKVLREQTSTGVFRQNTEIILGPLKIRGIKFEKSYSIIDFIQNDYEISIHFAIDFTLSNGEINHQNSYHSIIPSNNHYLAVMRAVGEIVQHFDDDKQIPLYGFGGMFPFGKDESQVCDCFALNGNIFAPHVSGMLGADYVYRQAIRKCRMSGPTNVSSILRLVKGQLQCG